MSVFCLIFACVFLVQIINRREREREREKETTTTPEDSLLSVFNFSVSE